MNLQIAILQSLEAVHPIQRTTKLVKSDVHLTQVTPPTLSDVKRALNKLESKGHVIGVSNEDTGTKWKVTDAGIARLVEYES